MANKEQFKLGEQAFNEGKFQEARRILSRITKDDEMLYAKAQLMLADTQLKLHNDRSALKYLKQLSGMENKEIEARKNVLYGEVYTRLDRIADAMHYFLKVTEETPDIYVEAQMYRGMIEFSEGDLDAAEVNFLAVSKKYPKHYAEAQYFLATIYEEFEEQDEAKKYLQNIEKEMDPEMYNEAQMLLAIIAGRNEELDEAKKNLENMDLTLGGEVIEDAKALLGEIELENDNVDEGIELLESIERNKNAGAYAQAQLTLANWYFGNDDADTAFKHLSKIKKTDNKEIYATACVNMGVYHMHNENKKQAIKLWNSVTQKDSENAYYEAQKMLEISKVHERVEGGDSGAMSEFPEDVQQAILDENLMNAFEEAENGHPEMLLNILEAIDSNPDIPKDDKKKIQSIIKEVKSVESVE